MINSQTQQKSKSTAGVHQQILMDWQGFILESTDTIFATQRLHHTPAQDWSDFLSSIFPSLQLLSLESPEIVFPRIASVTNFLDGIYDCSFMRVEWGDNDKVIVWNIVDYSHNLKEMQQVQQTFNEIRLRDAY